MSTSFSLVVGVEKHFDQKIPDVGHAAKDANAFAAALKAIGFLAENQELLVNAHATSTLLRYSIKQCLGVASPEDIVFIFFSGHGFSGPSGAYLVAHDSRFGNMEDTAVSLHEVFSLIRASRCKKIALFLDCCHAGLKFPTKEKNILAQMGAAELASFFAESEYHVAFGSCKDTEKSYWSDILEHGVWTYHLLQALSGKVPEILEKERYLRAASLQDYLVQAVPKTLRKTFTDRKVQTPMLYGSLTSNFLIADLDPVLPKASESSDVLARGFQKASFGEIKEGRVSSLPGFDKKKGHFSPTDHSSFSERFIANAGNELVEDRADKLYDRIKASFGYTRQELTIDKDPGSAVIRAKDFDVTLSLSQNADDPTLYRFELEVDSFSGGDVVAGDKFNEIFDGEFSFLKLLLENEQDVPSIIDKIEAKKPANVSINYPRSNEPTWVSITVDGQHARVVVSRKYVKIKLPHAKPRDFVQALNEAQNLTLGGNTSLGALLFPISQTKLKN